MALAALFIGVHAALLVGSRCPSGPRAAVVACSPTEDVATLRLDAALVKQGLCDSRSRAQAAIKGGLVTLGGKVLKKASITVAPDAPLELTASAAGRYVSRAGDKLRAALESFSLLDLQGMHALDVGASTGGFTDCMLQAGAASVTCVDVGQGQLHSKLQSDDRVTSLEKVNARNLTAEQLPRPTYDIVVCDLSFISLRLVLPSIWPLLERSERSRLVALVKPQFEAGRVAVSRGKGVIRDAKVQQMALREVCDFAVAKLPGCVVVGTIESPIKGGDGNREFLLSLQWRQVAEGGSGDRSVGTEVAAPSVLKMRSSHSRAMDRRSEFPE